MRRLIIALLLLGMLALPAAGAPVRYVALTFDDGPSGRYTRLLLEGLAQRDAHATFFLSGCRMAQYPELTEQIHLQGHEIGLRGYSFDSMKTMSRRKIAGELMDSGKLLPRDCRPVFFRPPGDLCTDGIRQVADARRLGVLSWSVDSRDWEGKSREEIGEAVVSRVRDGDIVLLHDRTMDSVLAALDIMDILKLQGFRFLTVSELARVRGVAIRPGRIYTSFPPKEKV